MDDIMYDPSVEKKINIDEIKWISFDQKTKYSLEVDDICYYIDDEIYYEMKEYYNLRKKYKNIIPFKYEIHHPHIYKIYIVSDNVKTSYHYTKESVWRALKNSLYGYFRRRRNKKVQIRTIFVIFL